MGPAHFNAVNHFPEKLPEQGQVLGTNSIPELP
jgi:hypothetical protein